MTNELFYWRYWKYLYGYIVCQFKGHPNPYKDYSYRCQRCHYHIYAEKEQGFMQ